MTNNGNRTNWPQIAAWTFGAWALMIPLAAGLVIANLQQQTENQERIIASINAHRAEVLQAQSVMNERIAGIAARQIDVMRRLDVLESRHLPRD